MMNHEEQMAQVMAQADERGRSCDLTTLTPAMWDVMRQLDQWGYTLGNVHSSLAALVRRGMVEGYHCTLTPSGKAALERWHSGEFPAR